MIRQGDSMNPEFRQTNGYVQVVKRTPAWRHAGQFLGSWAPSAVCGVTDADVGIVS